VTSNESFEEKRGSHLNRYHKIDFNVLDLALAHLQTLPHKKKVTTDSKNPNAFTLKIPT
jgi:hypothetical protein